MTHSQTSALVGFGVALVAVYAVASYLVGQLPVLQAPAVLALGITLDLTVLVPGLYYLVFVRGRGWPLPTVGLVFVVSLVGAAVILPSAYQAPLRVMEWLVLPVEGAVVGWGVVRLGRVLRTVRARGEDEDVLAVLRESFRESGFGAAAGAAAYEVAVLVYALGRWRAPLPTRPEAYSVHRRAGYGAVLAALLVAASVEVVGVHLLVARWSGAAAWGLTALSLYSVLWLVGDFQAIRHRPLLLERDRLRLRLGLRWEVEVPFDAVGDIVPVKQAPPRRKGYLSLATLGAPRYVVRLARPLVARGPYGWRKTVTSVGFAVDEAERFEAALQERFGAWQAASRGHGR